ncbi:MAG TPA: transcription antitermination factor NusB [Egicoccus sp.]|nr:transcription antitermination factor NusB [Egicoccus sp.]HSK23752.1 transcription antitermination factor NusB [Egicoccus sp.]
MGESAPTSSDPRRPSKRRTDTRDPRRSRERALKILFQADLRGDDAVHTLDEVAGDPYARAMLDDLDDLHDETDAVADVESQARLDAESGTTLETPARNVAPIDAFTRRLVEGVSAHRAEIDQTIERFARRWAIHRMPVVDRTVLRLATFELLHEDTSPAVVINEAVDLAKSLSTDDSGRYVNGVLESVRRLAAGELTSDPLDSPDDPGE